MPTESINYKAKTAKTLAIIAFCLVMAFLSTAIISDIAVFSKQIITFVFACIAAVFLFIFGIVLMLISIMFVFGVYLLNEYGFWPISWTINGFKEILADAAFTPEQIQQFNIIRLILLISCLIVLILSIVCLSISKSTKKDGYQEKQKLTKAFGIISLILSILGFLTGLIVLLILRSIS